MRALAIAVATAVFVAGATARADEDQVERSAERGWFAGDRGLSGKAMVGPAIHRLYDIGVITGDLQLALGSLTRAGGWYGTLGGRIGSTDGGLSFRQLAVGASWEAPVEEGLHLGVGLDATYVAFDRESTEARLEALGAGGYLFGSYDVWRTDGAALFLGLQFGTDVFPGDETPLLWGGAAHLGARLF